jgi:hypothetical protein
MYRPDVDDVRVSRRLRRLVRPRGVAAVAAFALTLTCAASAAAEERVGGGAFALRADLNALLIPLSVGALPAVTLPPEGGGPFSESLLATNALGLAPVGAAKVTTRGNSGLGSASSAASVLDVDLAGLVSVSAARSRCSAAAGDAWGTTDVSGLVVAGIPIATADAGPNTTIALPVGSVTLNEQIRTGGSVLTVNAVHVTLDAGVVGGDVVLAQSRCAVKSMKSARVRALRRAHKPASSS